MKNRILKKRSPMNLLLFVLLGTVVLFMGCLGADLFIVTFDTDGGSSVSSIEDIMPGVVIDEPERGPTKRGFRFVAWSLDGEVYDFTSAISVSVKLVAMWEAICYDIVYVLNDGTLGDGSPTEHVYGKVTTLVAPTRVDFIFAGWFTKSSMVDFDGVAELVADEYVETIALYAKWTPLSVPAESFSVGFDINGGDGTEVMASQEFTAGSPANLTRNVFTSVGKVFGGWNTFADGGGVAYGDEVSYTATGDITLFAQWTLDAVVEYTVTFDINGGTGGTTAAQTFQVGVAQGLTANGFVNTNHTFGGWDTLADGGGVAYGDEVSYTATGDITLFAQWTLDAVVEYTVTFDINGGTGGTTAAQTFQVGVAQGLTANGFVNTDHTFGGWDTLADGSGVAYGDEVSYTATGDVTLYAQWLTALDAAKQAKLQLLTETRATYDNVDYSAESVRQLDAILVQFQTQINAETNSMMFDVIYTAMMFNTAFDTILTKVQEETDKTVTFHINGGDGGQTMALQTFVNDVAQNLTVNGFTNTGHTFGGWDTLAVGGGVAYVDGVSYIVTTASRDITLFAQWTPDVVVVEYTVTFDRNGGTGGTTATQTFQAGVAQGLRINGFTKSSHTFGGWDTLPGGGGAAYGDEVSYTATGDIILYAQWLTAAQAKIQLVTDIRATYNDSDYSALGVEELDTLVTNYQLMINNYPSYMWSSWTEAMLRAEFDKVFTTTDEAGSKTVTFNINIENNGTTAVQSFANDAPQNLRANTFTRSGYVFKCWDTTADVATNGSGTEYADRESYTVTTASRHIVLYAQWMTELEAAKLEKLQLLADTRATYNDADYSAQGVQELDSVVSDFQGKIVYSFSLATVSAMDAAMFRAEFDKVLTAIGELADKTVTFHINGGDGGQTMTPQSFANDVAQNLTANAFSHTGYSFVGWNTKANRSGTVYGEGASYTVTTASRDLILYAQWTANDYTVDFDLQGGTGTATAITVTFDEKYPALPADPVNAPNFFVGWFTQASGGIKVIAGSTTVSPTVNHTLYAQWALSVDTVTFDKNGGTGVTMAAQIFQRGTSQNLTRNTYTKSSYFFGGWNTVANGSGTAYADEASYTATGDITLYAQWLTKAESKLQLVTDIRATYDNADYSAEGIQELDRLASVYQANINSISSSPYYPPYYIDSELNKYSELAIRNGFDGVPTKAEEEAT